MPEFDPANKTFLPEAAAWPEKIFQLEDGYLPTGGVINDATGSGTMNRQAKALADRTNYLKGEIEGIKTPVLASVADSVTLDAITTTSTRTAAQGALAPLFPFGGLVEHTEFGDGSARQIFSHETNAGVFLGRYFRRRLTGAWGAWRGEGVTTWPTGQPLPSQDIGTIYSDTYLTTLTHRTVTGFGPAYTGYASSHVGEGFDWSDATAPPNALAREGGNVSRTTYAALFAILGERFGAGDGSTTFGLPETRGEFLRGWDNGRGVDAGRALGALQNATRIRVLIDTFGGVYPTGTYAVGAWNADGPLIDSPVEGTRTTTRLDNTKFYASAAAEHNGGGDNTAFATRPRNISQMFCIKF